jgi:hypothetical protein
MKYYPHGSEKSEPAIPDQIEASPEKKQKRFANVGQA